MSEIILSDTAKEDLKNIWLYVAGEKDSPTSAKLLLTLILDKSRLRAALPQIGTPHPDNPQLRKFTVKKNYVVIYRTLDNKKGIEIVHIKHTSIEIECI